MVEDRLVPGDAAAVAGVTLSTAMLVMGVVFKVARYAGLVHFVLERVLGVAVTASQFCVAAEQIKIRVAGMVKARIVPVARVMTVSALVAAAAVVRIIFSVAIETLRRRIRESAVFMAVETSGFEVFSEQWVVGRRMIEFGLQPFCWLMAIDAVRAHSVLVGFVFFVAVNARRGRLPVLQIGLVAIFAVSIFVRSQQFEIGKAMIESGLIEDDNERITANMLRMAGRTLVSLDLGAPPVESGFLVNVDGDLFMAIHAKLPLPALVKSLVARRTFAFQIRMSLDNRTRHDQGLDILRRRIV